MNLTTERDALYHDLETGWDWLDRVEKHRAWLADPRNRQKRDMVERRLIETKLPRYMAVCDALNAPEQEELWEVGA